MGRKASATRYRERDATDREHVVRGADLERAIGEIVEGYLPASVVAAEWRRYVETVRVRLRRWPGMLVPTVGKLVADGAAPFRAALETQETLRGLLDALATGTGDPAPDPPASRRALARLRGFLAPLPAEASARERVITWRSRRAELRHLVRRGELEPLAAVRARQADAIAWARQILLNRVPQAGITAVQNRAAEPEIRAALAHAVEDALLELRRGDRAAGGEAKA